MRARSWMILVTLAAAAACGSRQKGTYGNKGMPVEQAKSQCEQIKQSEERCWNDKVSDRCAACLSECGFACGQSPTCPIEFNCPP